MKRYGIIGRPLAQSPSKDYFEEYFAKHSIDAVFQKYELKNLKNFRTFLKKEKLSGLLVTLPFKEEAYTLADSVNIPSLQASNILSIFHEEERIHIEAYNTDYLAFKDDLLSLNPDFTKPALIIGHGGAAKAVAYALWLLGISSDFVSRGMIISGRAESVLSTEKLSTYGLIVNATPLGMGSLQNQAPDINYNAVSPLCIAYDLVYNPEKTLFLSKCEEAGCRIHNGKNMLMRIYKMALETWKIH
jgi:shikimate dehydrogenase